MTRHPRRSRQPHGAVRLALALVAAVVVGAGCESATEPSPSVPPSASPIARGEPSAGTAPPGGDEGGGSTTPAPSAEGGGGGTPGGSPPAASAVPTAAPSSPPPARRPFVAADKGLAGEVFAFVTIDQVADATAELDWDATSTVVFFSLAANANGRLVRDSRWRTWTSPKTDALIARAHETGTHVVFSLSRFSWSARDTKTSTDLLASSVARQRLAEDVAGEVVRRGIDGVNVDFEPIPRGQKANFTDLIRRIRLELDARGRGYQLTFDVLGHFESYDVAGSLAAGADAVYLMGYHYAGTFSTIAHATAPLGGPRYSVGDAIDGLRKVARPDRIIVGVPYYGHIWPTASGSRNARTTGGGGDVLYRDARVLAERHPPRYDPAEAVQWSAWRVRDCASCALHWVQLYFDDARSLTAKWSDFRQRGLRGTGFWTWGFQGDATDLRDALRAVWFVPKG
jgi:spore germination protein YaaH